LTPRLDRVLPLPATTPDACDCNPPAPELNSDDDDREEEILFPDAARWEASRAITLEREIRGLRPLRVRFTWAFTFEDAALEEKSPASSGYDFLHWLGSNNGLLNITLGESIVSFLWTAEVFVIGPKAGLSV
jgi:hypothetical protein